MALHALHEKCMRIENMKYDGKRFPVLWDSCGNWPHSIVMGFVRIDEKMDFIPIMQHTGELILRVT